MQFLYKYLAIKMKNYNKKLDTKKEIPDNQKTTLIFF